MKLIYLLVFVLATSCNGTSQTNFKNPIPCKSLMDSLPKSDVGKMMIQGILFDRTFISDKEELLKFSQSKGLKPIQTNHSLIVKVKDCDKYLTMPNLDPNAFKIPLNSEVDLECRVIKSNLQHFWNPIIIVDKITIRKK